MFQNKIYFLRHADVNRSANLHFNELELSDLGLRQANGIVSYLNTLSINMVISSPFRRATQTIEPFIEKNNLDLILDERLCGRLIGEIKKDKVRDFFENSWNNFDYTVSGAETAFECIERVRELIDEIDLNCSGKNILLVSHSNPISLYLSTLGNENEVDFNWFSHLRSPSLFKIDKNSFNELKLPLIYLKRYYPPIETNFDDFLLEALAPKHNKIDYAAWNSSREGLKDIFGPRNSWPCEVSSLEENYKDLEKHFEDHQNMMAFTYCILNQEKNDCLGCLYIRPTKAKEFDCRVDFWFRNSHKEFENDFYEWLQSWLTNDWNFENVAFPGRCISWNEYYEHIDQMSFFSATKYQEKAEMAYLFLKKQINLLLPQADVHHIGSSAVPGVISKGDLDIYVGVETNEFSRCLEALKTSGLNVKENTFRCEELCMFETIYKGIEVGIQLVDSKSTYTNFLTFRDTLINSKNVRDRYNKLKQKSVGLSPVEYRKVKSKFITGILSVNRLTEKELQYWNSYLDILKDKPNNPHVEASIAGNLEIADELLSLYLSDKKTAGSGLVKDYELAGDPLPNVGNYWIILDSKKESRCIVKTVRVEKYQFDQVPERVAIAEGEGDLSLEYWRKTHLEFFTPFLEKWGVTNIDKEIVVTEFYEVVYK